MSSVLGLEPVWCWEPSSLDAVFRECDCGGKGYLSREDLKIAVVMIFGYKPSKMETDRMMAPVLRKHLPGMSLDQFVNLMSSKVTTQDLYEQTRQIFTAFDVHCRGFLMREDFKRAFWCIAPHLPEQTVFEAFRELDWDSDGHVSYKDFETVMSYVSNIQESD